MNDEQTQIEVFKPEQVAKQSGIYRADHRRHRQSQELTVLAGEKFPSCPGCTYGISYTLIHPAVHIYERT